MNTKPHQTKSTVNEIVRINESRKDLFRRALARKISVQTALKASRALSNERDTLMADLRESRR